MLLVGLTGGIGSGKSTVSRLLADRGAVIVDADLLAREVVERGRPAYDAIVERFGTGVVAADGALDRPALAAIVFADPAARKELEAITWPAVGALMAERIAAETDSDHIVVLDVPLLVESARTNTAATIVVDCPEAVALARLIGQRGMSEDDVRRRMAAQVGREERLRRADVVVHNDGSVDALHAEVERVWAWLRQLATRHDKG